MCIVYTIDKITVTRNNQFAGIYLNLKIVTGFAIIKTQNEIVNEITGLCLCNCMIQCRIALRKISYFCLSYFILLASNLNIDSACINIM